jgi:poly(glycerol-phosphate) alpha-glucosyltransferase
MFDFFLGNLHVPQRSNTVKEWLANHSGSATDLGTDVVEGNIQVHGWRVIDGDQQFLLREDVQSGQISSIVYGTTANFIKHSEIYDDRGFKTLDNIMGADGRVTEQRFFSHTGEQIIIWRLDGKGATRSIFLKHQGEQRIFMNNDGLITYFLDVINQENGGDNLIISDRYENTPALARMKTPARRYVYIL